MGEHRQLSWWNGELAEQIDISDRGFQFSDGFFETILLAEGKAPLIAEHKARIKQSAQRLRINVDDGLIDSTVSLAIDSVKNAQAILKIIVTRGSGGQGYKGSMVTQANIAGVLRDYSPLPVTALKSGVEVMCCEYVLPSNPVLAGMKLLGSMNYVMASFELSESNAFEGLLCDDEGFYVEGTRTNLWLVKGNRIITPDLSRCGVAGVMRRYILDYARSLENIEWDFRRVDETLLMTCDEIFLTNAVFGVIPVCAILNKRELKPGKITQRLMAWLNQTLFNQR